MLNLSVLFRLWVCYLLMVLQFEWNISFKTGCQKIFQYFSPIILFLMSKVQPVLCNKLLMKARAFLKSFLIFLLFALSLPKILLWTFFNFKWKIHIVTTHCSFFEITALIVQQLWRATSILFTNIVYQY